MKRTILYLTLLTLCLACIKSTTATFEKPLTKRISIFEIYLKDTLSVGRFSNLLRDTLKLPVEWGPFDFFGNNVVYDAAFYLGNTTLELLAVNPTDSTVTEEARYNRILFGSENIDSTFFKVKTKEITYQPPFDFKISSNNEELIIGKQINLDSMSKLSNINIAFWEYVDSGYSFAERTIKGKTIEELKAKLDQALNTNPMGIIGLKEVHLSIKQPAIDEWHKLLGPSESNKWILAEGPAISYALASKNVGVDWITLNVRSLEEAKIFLSQKNLLSSEKNKVSIDSTKIYGLKIYLEE